MSDYKKSINHLRHHGVPYRTYIDENADMIIRYNENDNNYVEEVFNSNAELICIINMEDGVMYLQS